MGFFGLLELLPLFIGLFAAFSAAVPALIYLGAAWRNRQDGRDERRLALVSVYGAFANLGFTMATLSLTVLLAMLFEGPPRGEMLKVPIALVLSGVIIFAVTYFPLRSAVGSDGSRAGRMYVGLTAFTATLFTAIAFTGLVVTVFTGGRVSLPIAVLITQAPVAVFGAVLLARSGSRASAE